MTVVQTVDGHVGIVLLKVLYAALIVGKERDVGGIGNDAVRSDEALHAVGEAGLGVVSGASSSLLHDVKTLMLHIRAAAIAHIKDLLSFINYQLSFRAKPAIII